MTIGISSRTLYESTEIRDEVRFCEQLATETKGKHSYWEAAARFNGTLFDLKPGDSGAAILQRYYHARGWHRPPADRG